MLTVNRVEWSISHVPLRSRVNTLADRSHPSCNTALLLTGFAHLDTRPLGLLYGPLHIHMKAVSQGLIILYRILLHLAHLPHQ